MRITTGDVNSVVLGRKTAQGSSFGMLSISLLEFDGKAMGKGSRIEGGKRLMKRNRQLNDIWPGTSWALVDVNLNRKPSFYITKRALSKAVVGMERTVTESIPYMVTSYPEPKERVQIWAVSGHLQSLTTTLKLSAFDIESGDEVVLPEEERERSVLLKDNGMTEIGEIDIPRAEQTVVVAYLEDQETGERLARWVDWPEPLKFVRFKKGLHVKVEVGEREREGRTCADAPVKGVVLAVAIGEGGEDAVWDDNFVDLVPGEVVSVGVQGLEGRKVECRWLCDWEQEEGFEL
jgi:beta-mannosidase